MPLVGDGLDFLLGGGISATSFDATDVPESLLEDI